MDSKASVLRSPPQLPNELYRDIIENLHHYKERRILLRLALVNKVWCVESQRVLFRTVIEDSWDLNKRDSVMRTHRLLLEAITLNPTRLGPYVQTYQQYHLIGHPVSAANPKLLLAQASSYLWDLTATALPTLVNLKHLLIVPFRDHPNMSRASLLEGCSFKLESLTWGFDSENPCSSDPFVEFLRTQHDLLHLEVGSDPVRQDFSWLPDDVCPSLISAACRPESAARISERRNVVGLSMAAPTAPDSHISPLHRLTYLSIPADRHLMSNLQTVASNITLLELTSCDLRTIQYLPDPPNLQVLALIRAAHGASPSRFVGHRRVDVQVEYDIQRMQLAIESFRRCSNLEYVIIEAMHRGEKSRRFRKLPLSGPNRGPDTLLDVQSEEFSVEHHVGLPWWSAYVV